MTTSSPVAGRRARPRPPAIDLLVLAGGRGRRLGGQDKAALVVAGEPLLDRLLGTVDLGPRGSRTYGGRVVVVGDTPVPAGVLRTVEEPAGGGPVAGIAAGLDLLEKASSHDWVAVVAVDQPRAGEVLPQLRHELTVVPPGVDAVRAWRPETGDQWLLALYRRTSLRAALDRLPTVHGASVRDLVTPLVWLLVLAPEGVLGDVDTWEDARAWEDRLSAPGD